VEVSGQLNAATPSPNHFKSRERKGGWMGGPKALPDASEKRKNLLFMPDFKLQVVESVA
jgi:hypothetical protein